MAKKDRSEELAKWTHWLEQGERYREEFGDSEAWQRYRNYYRGIFPAMSIGDSKKPATALPFNMTFSMARTTVPKVYLRDPYINVTPRHAFLGQDPEIDMRSRVVESVANWLVQEMDVKTQMRSAALDGFLCNRMFWKMGYDSQFGHKPSNAISFSGEEQTSQEDKKGNRIEHNINVKPGMPWVLRADPDMMIVPFGVKTLEECAWIDNVILRPTEDVKACTVYKNTSDLEGTHLDRILLNNNKKEVVQEMIKHVDMCELHEIRDMRNKKIIVLLTGDEKGRFLRDDDDLLQIDGPPIVSAFFNEDPDWFWGPPDARIMEPQQLEINETNTQNMYHRRINLVKFFYDLNKVAPDMVQKMLSGNIGPGIGVNGSVSDAVSFLAPHMPPDLANWIFQQEAAVRTLLGMGRQQSGAASTGRRTATESQIIQAGFESRMDEKRDAMATALKDIMRKALGMVFKFWKQEKVTQVVGYDGARYWVKYNADMIRGEYDLKVDVESMSPIGKNEKRKSLTALIQALANNPRANMDYLLRELIREFEWVDAMKALPEAQETAGGQAMSMRDFVGQQRGLAMNPTELKARAGQTVQALEGMVA
jgi:hypothetical protein